MSLKILIVEDEILIADYIKDILQEFNYTNITIANDSSSAIDAFSSFQPDLILLDINIDERYSGIELSKKKNEGAKIIYVTAQNDIQTIQKAIATLPESYITKPIKKIDLLTAIQLVEQKYKNKSISLKDGTDIIKVSFDDILFVKSDGNYIEIQTVLKKHVLRQSLDSFLLELNSDTFIKVHRSYIVNKNKISKKKATFILIEKYEIPISRSIDFNI